MTDEERKFLDAYDASAFAGPLATVDMAIFCIREDALHVLLIKRGNHPDKGRWALPGGFVDTSRDADTHATALRKLSEKTGVKTPYLEQVVTVGGADRDPRGWALTVLYFALIDHAALSPANENVEEAEWVEVHEALERELAFDHRELLTRAARRLAYKARYSALPLRLLPAEFTLVETQRVFEILLGARLEKKSFRRRILAADIVEETGQTRPSARRPAQLYRLTREIEEDFAFPGLIHTKPALL
ncbi:NUDIX domain-containing protein [Maricaulis sp.]|uniref:NUDIX domain-containing protein n=1 Tax=Maricaulis sp. TaxID=1486257 RepID=UPI001B2A01F8|nr:NUDIX domain-containing protein [Maricaulis sp.]MBO6796960.1 NUDIX hydrolase [Maricaulis sp.]